MISFLSSLFTSQNLVLIATFSNCALLLGGPFSKRLAEYEVERRFLLIGETPDPLPNR